MLTSSIQRHCWTSGKVVQSDGKIECWTFWILSCRFHPREIPEPENSFAESMFVHVANKKKVVRTKNLNSACFIAERNWYHPEKLEFLFFWNSNFWSIQLPKNYGCFFPPELKIQWNVEKMPVNYSNCRRNLMNFSNSWVQEKMFTRKKSAGFG